MLGAGGMGVVYLAEQDAPLRRRVALKVIKRGMDTQQVIRRFQSERDALALMDHPGIARVLDAGSTGDGSPYFAMEYVAGLPLTEHCDQERLDTRRRLALFREVCHAVQHAHQKGVVHRDLKPSNILVAPEDGVARPKVIDFGVAKAVDARLDDGTSLTTAGVIVGTPAYMSPEQAESGLDVDTRADIYSLGVVLYELLVGALPLDPKRLRALDATEVKRVLRESDPARPSTRVATLADVTQVAERRRADPAGLSRALKGDLDAIVLKAMDKDRARRYASASELAEDIGRFLAGEPVVARAPSVAYRFGKLVARHRVAAGTAAAVLLALLAGATLAAVGLVRARRAEAEAQRLRAAAQAEAAQARAVSDFLRQVLGAASPRQQGRDVKVSEALGRAVASLDDASRLPPALEAAVRETVSATYLELGELPAAEAQARAALALRRREPGPESPEALAAQVGLAAVLQQQGRYAEAVALGRGALAGQRKALEAGDLQLTTTLNDLAVALSATGEAGEAEALLREALEIRRQRLGPGEARTLLAASNLASLLAVNGRHAEAEPLLREVLAAQRRSLGPEHSNTLFTLKALAGVLHDQKKLDEADATYREALAASRRVSGPRHVDSLVTGNDYALLLMDLGRLSDAEALLRDAVAGAEAALPKGHRFTALFRRNLGDCLTRQGRYREAEGELLGALAMLNSAQASARERGGVALRLARLFEAWGKPARAAHYRALAAGTD
jgi:tRNA A-37 threonylcarbamoyl transferase component Bud32